MSYILDALKKSERERNIGAVPNLQDEQSSTNKPMVMAIWIFSAVIIINIVAIAWYYVLTPRSETPQQQSPIVFTAPVTAYQPPAPQQNKVAPVAQPTVTNQAESPFSNLVKKEPDNLLDEQGTRISPRVTVASEPLEVEQGGVDTSAIGDKNAALHADPTPGVRSTSDNRPVIADGALPFLEQMPVHIQSAVLPLNVDVHVYDESQSNRFIFVEGRRYREGQELKPGVILDGIEPASLVLKSDGLVFRYFVHH